MTDERLAEIINTLERANKSGACEDIYADANWLLSNLLTERTKVAELQERINPIIEHVIKMNKDSHIRMKEELPEGKVAYEFGIQDFTSSILGDLMRSGFIYRNNDGELITKGV